ncbi:hypothetical protein R1A27_17410 [Methylobacterium sp. NMS12]|uniref:avidin/streptavidin family protein n=1 Tax=Methylobacterium sp. NMS12 TaxID=3079766 RepID=UPI003F88289E
MFAGGWRNKTGDLLHLTQCGEAIAGTYVAARSDAKIACRGNLVVGSVNGRAICIVTIAETPRRMKSWSGTLYEDKKHQKSEIRMICHSLERLTDEMDIVKSLGIIMDKFTKDVSLDNAEYDLEDQPKISSTTPNNR